MIDPRKSSRNLSAAMYQFLSMLGLLLSAISSAHALTYVESSPVGPEFPEWEGGDTGLCFADIDSDGNVDLLSIGDHGSPYINTDQHGVMTYFGDGSGGWSIHMEGEFGYGGIAVGDVDHDGLLDVGYGMHHNYSDTDFGDQLIEVALGDGSGMSWTPWDDGLAQSGETYGMFATRFADFDADGDLDLVSLSFGFGNGLHVYRNDGNGTWTQTWARTDGNATSTLAVADINGDGYCDIASSYQSGAAWLGDGTGQFTQAIQGLPVPGLLGLRGVDLADVDRDGRADLSFVQNGGVRVYLWREDHWEAATGLPSAGSYEMSRLCDMNADGRVDVVGLGGGICTLWLGDGTGGWTQSGGFVAAASDDLAAFEVGGDIDHNGLPDIAFVQREGSWPNDNNRLHVYREASIPSARSIVSQFPRGNEVWRNGSVQTIRWTSARLGGEPVSVDIDVSVTGPDGPWQSVAAAVPDGGHWQWTVDAAPSSQAHLRLTLHQGSFSVSATVGPISVIGDVPASVSEPGSSITPRLTALSNPVVHEARFRLVSMPNEALSNQTRNSGKREAAGSYEGATLRIFGVNGRVVRDLAMSAGHATWDLCDQRGVRVAPGVYFARTVIDATVEAAPRSYGRHESDIEAGVSSTVCVTVVR